MSGNFKREILFFLILTFIILVIIAGSLSGLKLEAGIPLPELDSGQNGTFLTEEIQNIVVNEFLKKIIIVIVIIGFIIAVYLFLKKTGWKNLRLYLLFFLSLAVGSALILFLLSLLPHSSNNDVLDKALPMQKEIVRSPLGKIPILFFWFLSILFTGLLVFLGIRIFRDKFQDNNGYCEIKLEAQKAKGALLNGEDFKNVIIRCYKQMCISLENEHDIQREKDMTTGEFERLLDITGAPIESVRVLTCYFEAVRYGKWEPQSLDEQNAIQCFEAIIEHFRNEKRRNAVSEKI